MNYATLTNKQNAALEQWRTLLRTRRGELGLSRDVLGEQVRVRASTVASWETGLNLPRPKTYISLCEKFPELHMGSVYTILTGHSAKKFEEHLRRVKADSEGHGPPYENEVVMRETAHLKDVAKRFVAKYISLDPSVLDDVIELVQLARELDYSLPELAESLRGNA